jgi:hypothetical protein
MSSIKKNFNIYDINYLSSTKIMLHFVCDLPNLVCMDMIFEIYNRTNLVQNLIIFS